MFGAPRPRSDASLSMPCPSLLFPHPLVVSVLQMAVSPSWEWCFSLPFCCLLACCWCWAKGEAARNRSCATKQRVSLKSPLKYLVPSSVFLQKAIWLSVSFLFGAINQFMAQHLLGMQKVPGQVGNRDLNGPFYKAVV